MCIYNDARHPFHWNFSILLPDYLHNVCKIPLVLWTSGGTFHWLALPLSFILVPISVFMSRHMIPVAIRAPKNDGEQDLYLNINLSHETVSEVVEMQLTSRHSGT